MPGPSLQGTGAWSFPWDRGAELAVALTRFLGFCTRSSPSSTASLFPSLFFSSPQSSSPPLLPAASPAIATPRHGFPRHCQLHLSASGSLTVQSQEGRIPVSDPSWD